MILSNFVILYRAFILSFFLVNGLESAVAVSINKGPSDQIQNVLKRIFTKSTSQDTKESTNPVLPWKKPTTVLEFKDILHFEEEEVSWICIA